MRTSTIAIYPSQMKFVMLHLKNMYSIYIILYSCAINFKEVHLFLQKHLRMMSRQC